MEIIKAHSCGNDFVLVDRRGNEMITSLTVSALANRKTGIGCDQVLVIKECLEDGVYVVEIFNADGSSAGACGNGFLCLASYLFEYVTTLSHLTFIVGNKHFKCRKGECGNAVVVDMGNPTFQWDEIPMSMNIENVTIDWCGRTVYGIPVGIGNPHLVFFVDFNIDHVDINLLSEPACSFFPCGVNISVVCARTFKARTLERGVGETLACGSGACAIFSAGQKIGLQVNSIVFPGGTLSVSLSDGDTLLLSSKCCHLVFKGVALELV